MCKRVVAMAALGLLLVPATMSAQTPQRERAVRPAVRAAAQVRHRVRQAVRRGARTGQLQADDLARLRADIRALRERMIAIRRSGQRATPEQRLALRQDIRRARQDLRERLGAIRRLR